MIQMINTFKKVALNAVEESKPTDISFGTVIQVSPLKVSVDQRFTLSEKFLILSSLVTDFKVDMQSEHSHETYTVKLGLQLGEKVILLRKQGGQQYLVLDRIR